MSIIRNIEDNIIVIYELKSFYVTLAVGKFFPNIIHRANYHFTHSKKLKRPIILPYYSWVVLCTRPRSLLVDIHPKLAKMI
jgi:hypothetical protein